MSIYKNVLTAAFFLIFSMWTNVSFAQITIDLGGNVGDIKRALIKQGYTRVDFTGRGFTKYRVQACRNGKRWKFKVDWRGKTNEERVIGKCRQQVDEKSIRKILRDRGFRRINLENQNGMYVAIACANRARYRVEVNPYGDIRKERRIGQCLPDLSPTDIEVQLKERGYDRFNWIDRQLPRYVAEACYEGRRVEIVANRRGDIASSRNIGRCRSNINPQDIPAILANRGYERVQVTDDRLPRYAAIACLDGNKMEVTLNRNGRITDKVVIGKCRRPMDSQQIADFVRGQGFSHVYVAEKSALGYTIDGCYSEVRYRFVLSPFGELRDEKNLGECRSKSLFEMIKDEEKNGFTAEKFYMVGCEKGNQIRIEFNQFGQKINRKRQGRCDNLRRVRKD